MNSSTSNSWTISIYSSEEDYVWFYLNGGLMWEGPDCEWLRAFSYNGMG